MSSSALSTARLANRANTATRPTRRRSDGARHADDGSDRATVTLGDAPGSYRYIAVGCALKDPDSLGGNMAPNGIMRWEASLIRREVTNGREHFSSDSREVSSNSPKGAIQSALYEEWPDLEMAAPPVFYSYPVSASVLVSPAGKSQEVVGWLRVKPL